MSTDPWHTLTVTGLHYHNDPQCPGHTHPDDDTCDDEIEHELTHPDSCPAEQPCCHDAPLNPLGLGTAATCNACANGAHEQCTSKSPWRCHTDQEISEYYSENELPTVPGTYRVSAWSHKDYFGEYDGGVNCEGVTVPAAPTEPATCKHEPWPKVQTFTPPPLSAVTLELIATEN